MVQKRDCQSTATLVIDIRSSITYSLKGYPLSLKGYQSHHQYGHPVNPRVHNHSTYLVLLYDVSYCKLHTAEEYFNHDAIRYHYSSRQGWNYAGSQQLASRHWNSYPFVVGCGQASEHVQQTSLHGLRQTGHDEVDYLLLQVRLTVYRGRIMYRNAGVIVNKHTSVS